MFTMMIFWVTTVGIQIHSSSAVFETKAQCEVEASKIRASVNEIVETNIKIKTVCVSGERR